VDPAAPADKLWARLKEIFQAAIERTGSDRAVFVDEACRAHPELEARLRALLASHSEAEDFLETPAYAQLLAGAPSNGGDAEILRPGEVVDDTYEVQSTLGAGGMGVVYRVIHRGLKRPFAAKVIHARFGDDPGFVERFEREAVALGRLKHPNIVDVTDYGVERDEIRRPYLIMECLDGATLAEQLRSGPLPIAAALPVFEGIAAALDYAHSQGVLHLDLKPANVSLPDGKDATHRVKILDFGLAQFTASEGGVRTQTGALAGTPAYVAPELLDGHLPTAAADIYAFGVLMYEMLTGRPPFEGSTAEILRGQRDASPPRASSVNPAVPADLDDALAAILAKDPAARPRTAGAAFAAVRAAVLTHQQRDWRRSEIPRRLLIATALGLALGAIAPLISGWSPLRRLELLTVDARFAASSSRQPSGNIVLLLLDDGSLAADPTPVSQRADAVGRDLQRIVEAGARAVAVDFLLPAWWNDSGPFTRFVLEHSERLTLAAFSSDDKVIGPECIAGVTTIALGADRAAALFGFINLGEDEDGVTRMTRSFFRDREGGFRPAFAMRAVLTSRLEIPSARTDQHGDRFWIDHRLDPTQFTRVPWKDLDATLRERPEVFRGRLVLAGADHAASGDERRSPGGTVLSGVVVHGLIADTILSGFPLWGVGWVGLMLMSITASASFASVALVFRWTVAATTIIAFSAVHLAVSFPLLAETGLMAPCVVPLVAGFVAAAVAVGIRGRRRRYPA
jgi:serine/threonine protein kinase